MRKAAVFLIAVFAMMLALAAIVGQSLAIMQRIAHVSSAKGHVELMKARTAEFVPLGPREYVKAGDTIRTGGDGQVILNWVDGTRILVAPNTTLKVLKCQLNRSSKATTSVFRLDVGHLWVRVLEILSGKSKFEIRTPSVTAGVRGTIFSVAVAPDGRTDIQVVDGKVALKTRGKVVEVPAGRWGRVSGGNVTVAELNPATKLQWQHLGDILGPLLELDDLPSGNVLPPPGSQIVISGRTERGAQVTVNGRMVETDSRGRFDVLLTVPSENHMVIEVAATDAKGMTTRRRLELKRQ